MVSDSGVDFPAAGGPDLDAFFTPSSMAPAWDFASAVPSLKRMAVACGLKTTLCAGASFISRSLQSEAHE